MANIPKNHLPRVHLWKEPSSHFTKIKCSFRNRCAKVFHSIKNAYFCSGNDLVLELLIQVLGIRYTVYILVYSIHNISISYFFCYWFLFLGGTFFYYQPAKWLSLSGFLYRYSTMHPVNKHQKRYWLESLWCFILEKIYVKTDLWNKGIRGDITATY